MTFNTHLENQENIRLISVIAHVDHGKTTLTDSLLARAGIIDENQAGSKRGTDTMEEEKERGITIRSTGVSMHFQEVKKPGDNYVVHLVDSPGHVDFSSEVTAALRVSDGALVVVDCIEGVCAQTETVLRQALAERVKPVLVLNKIDRAVLELKLSPEDAYKSFEKTIQAVNDVISTYADSALGDLTLHPAKGNVVFASGLFGWGFTLHQFASKIIAKSNLTTSVDEVAKRLWGDHFFNEETKKFSKSATSPSGKPLERYACKIVFAPIFKMVQAIMEGNMEVVTSMLASAGTALAEKDKDKTGKELMRVAMRMFLPLADALLHAIVDHVPNPKIAQKYRVDLLYDGDLTDRFAEAIRTCDPNGPLVAYISKLFPVPNTKSFFAFGRIFSGTAKQGQKVWVFDPSRTSKAKEERTKSIQNLLCMSIRAMDRLESCPCGNIMAIAGIDSMLIKAGTISDDPECGSIKSMKFSVSPVVRAAVSCKSAADLPKLVDGLRALAKVDPCVQCIVDEESGEHIVGCAGDLHLQVCMRILQNDYCKGVSVIVSEPMVSYRETIAQESSETYLTKSPNKHNRLYGIAQPLSAQLCAEIDESPSIVTEDSKARAQRLIESGWDDNEAKRKIWCFGPELEPTNALVDGTFGLAFMNEIADHMKSAFSWATNEGPICGEPVRGVKFSLKDATLHADAIHRGGGQIIPTARRLYHACIVGSSPRLMEPIYLVEVQTTQEYSGNVYSVIARKRGQVFAEEHREGTPIVTLKANLPVMESFNLTADLRASCHGQAFPQCAFSHWQIMEGDPLVPGNLANTVAAAVRQRKKMPAAIPTLEGLVDKL